MRNFSIVCLSLLAFGCEPANVAGPVATTAEGPEAAAALVEPPDPLQPAETAVEPDPVVQSARDDGGAEGWEVLAPPAGAPNIHVVWDRWIGTEDGRILEVADWGYSEHGQLAGPVTGMVTHPGSESAYIVGTAGQLLAGPVPKWSSIETGLEVDFTAVAVGSLGHVIAGTADGRVVPLSDSLGDPDVQLDGMGSHVDPQGRAVRDIDGAWVVGDQGLLLEWPCKYWMQREPPEAAVDLIAVAALRDQPTVLTASGVAYDYYYGTWTPLAVLDGAESLRGSLGVGHTGRLFDLADEAGPSMTSIGTAAHLMAASQDHRLVVGLDGLVACRGCFDN